MGGNTGHFDVSTERSHAYRAGHKQKREAMPIARDMNEERREAMSSARDMNEERKRGVTMLMPKEESGDADAKEEGGDADAKEGGWRC